MKQNPLAIALVGALAFTTAQAQQVPIPSIAAQVPGPPRCNHFHVADRTSYELTLLGRPARLRGLSSDSMCQKCDASPAGLVSGVPRRNFLKLAATAAAGLAISRYALAAEKVAPPKASNVLSPDAALERLIRGNSRYVNGAMKSHDFIAERPALVMGQNPFAGILSCADSRIAPEYAFDTGRGDLFVCRVAGNFANKDSIASFEYGVAVLGVPLILVLGHEACGAVDSTIKAVKDGAKFPGHIPSLVKALSPAVESSIGQPGSLLDNSIHKNVLLNVKKLKSAAPILSKAAEENKLRVAGGVYHLETGRVEIIA